MRRGFIFLILFFLFLPPMNVFAVLQIEINTASSIQLEEIVGIGPSLAQRIIDARPFTTINDLLKVKGIGEKTLQKIKDQGVAYVEGQQTTPTQNITPPPVTETIKQELPEVKITYPSGVVINEVLPAPQGADEENEYIEIYNNSTADINISGWRLQDTQGASTIYYFPENSIIKSGAYILLKRTQTKITLNNDTDELHLSWPNGNIIDSVSFTKTSTNQSYNKTASGFKWSATKTPGSANIITQTIASATKKKSTTLPKTEKTDNKYLSALSEPLTGSSDDLNTDNASSPWLLFLVAMGITIVGAITTLLIKLKILKKSNVRS